ncbi:hypothetical protein [Tenacibaculum sp. SSH1-16]|uniref:hypothetical protein n=1 Tax=Tenacibaculum sp. SSH1-16 TaxID=3136667 RepID=UPI0032C47DE3
MAKKMTYSDLIEKLGKIVDDGKMLLRVEGEIIYIDRNEFYLQQINKIQRLLQLYGECDWWIKPSTALKDGVMYKIYILTYL